jgi:hypothetical protein
LPLGHGLATPLRSHERACHRAITRGGSPPNRPCESEPRRQPGRHEAPIALGPASLAGGCARVSGLLASRVLRSLDATYVGALVAQYVAISFRSSGRDPSRIPTSSFEHPARSARRLALTIGDRRRRILECVVHGIGS